MKRSNGLVWQMAGVGLLLVGFGSVSSGSGESESDGPVLTSEELASIRGASDGGGCWEINGSDCRHPYAGSSPLAVDECQACKSASATHTWPDYNLACPAATYATPGNPCQSPTNWGYSGKSYIDCRESRLGDTPNNKVAKTTKGQPCMRVINCKSPTTFAIDATCTMVPWGGTMYKAPSDWVKGPGRSYTRTVYSASLCTGGTDANNPAYPDVLADDCRCVNPK